MKASEMGHSYLNKPQPVRRDKLIDPTYQDPIDKLIKELESIPGLTIDQVGSWLWVSGTDPADKKTQKKLKKLGLRWCRNKARWYLAGEECKGNGKRRPSWSRITATYGLFNKRDDSDATSAATARVRNQFNTAPAQDRAGVPF